MPHTNEHLAQPSSPEQLSSPDHLEARVHTALEQLEVDASPEVIEAVEGYYRDHYALADTMTCALAGTLDPESIESVLRDTQGLSLSVLNGQLHEMREYNRMAELPSARDSLRLIALAVQNEMFAPEDQKAGARQDVLRTVQSALSEDLFQEQAVAITTLGDEERNIVETTYDQLIEEAKKLDVTVSESGVIHWPWSGKGVEGAAAKITKKHIFDRQQRAKEDFWDDVRFGGQLEYHNTPYLGDISVGGGIMPRTEQFRRFGQMKAVNSPEREQMHSVVPHFSESYDPHGYKSDPLASRRGEVEHKDLLKGTVAVPLAELIKAAPFARDAQYATVRVKSETPLDRIPISQSVGQIGAGQSDRAGRGGGDRVFFSSPSAYGEQTPDQFVVPLDKSSTLVFYGDEEIVRSPLFGLGESMPGRLHIESSDDAAQKIQELQAHMLEQYNGSIVVPLRRGIFDFWAENMHLDDVKHRSTPQFVKNPTRAASTAA